LGKGREVPKSQGKGKEYVPAQKGFQMEEKRILRKGIEWTNGRRKRKHPYHSNETRGLLHPKKKGKRREEGKNHPKGGGK